MLCTITISLTIAINLLVKAKNVISSAYCSMLIVLLKLYDIFKLADEQNATQHGRIVSSEKGNNINCINQNTILYV